MIVAAAGRVFGGRWYTTNGYNDTDLTRGGVEGAQLIQDEWGRRCAHRRRSPVVEFCRRVRVTFRTCGNGRDERRSTTRRSTVYTVARGSPPSATQCRVLWKIQKKTGRKWIFRHKYRIPLPCYARDLVVDFPPPSELSEKFLKPGYRLLRCNTDLPAPQWTVRSSFENQPTNPCRFRQKLKK